MNLALLQSQFAQSMRNPGSALPPVVAGRSETQRHKRFNVYRNNMHASLATTLSARFPVIERLVGADFFRAMALVFVAEHPPTSPVLAWYGEAFPDFLAEFAPASDLVYLPDVARLEWLRNSAFHATDASTTGLERLASADGGQLTGVTMTLHPAARWIASDYPIVSIWDTNTNDDVVCPIGPRSGGEVALVTRPSLDVLVVSVPKGTDRFAAALASGATLGVAAASASREVPDFDLAVAISCLFRSGAVTDVSIGNSAPAKVQRS